MDLYSIPKTPATQQSNKLFVSGFSGQWANKADLTTFLKKNRPDLSANTSFALISVANGTNPQKGYDAGIEANLDIQYTTGIASGVPISFVSVGPTDTETDKEFFVALQDEANALLTMKTPPTVLTSSYSLNENLISQSLAKSICNLYMQLGARGVSVLFSSGDGGIGGGHPTECKNKPFLPTFPGVCPYVTAVGATQIDHSSDHEKGANFGGGSSSSGGFSNYFPTPAYQSAQVSSYVKALGSTYAGRYNASGRGLPDVSAVGVNYTIVADQHAELVNGTSCSTPMFAGLVALLNDRLIAAGKAPLGFLNPLLYSAGGTAALTDITVGNNPGCGTKGFNATKGWDPVTGLGTPVFPKLLTAIGL
ncbi:hypothetical protein HWV62_7762 [Athelia sp. TMB]|nr:hypothetical protein HWV62_7762 [Athelia sp. TMB]